MTLRDAFNIIVDFPYGGWVLVCVVVLFIATAFLEAWARWRYL